MKSEFFFLFEKESLFFSVFPFFEEFEVVVPETTNFFVVLVDLVGVVLELRFGILVPVVLPIVFVSSGVVFRVIGFHISPVLNVVLVPVEIIKDVLICVVGVFDILFNLISGPFGFFSELLSIVPGILVGLLLEELPEVFGVQGFLFSKVEVVLSSELVELELRNGFWVSVLSQGSVGGIECFLHFSHDLLLVVIGDLVFSDQLLLILTLDSLSLILLPLPVPHGIISSLDWSKRVIPLWSNGFDFSEEFVDSVSEGFTSPFDTLTIFILIVVVFLADGVGVVTEHIPLA